MNEKMVIFRRWRPKKKSTARGEKMNVGKSQLGDCRVDESLGAFSSFVIVFHAPDVEDVVAADQNFAQVARQRTVDVLLRVGQLVEQERQG